ncbi:MAG: hypothetical protein KatS3mg110_1190 [Pirellulaceae bacterium]|nr:MAG: hypothetical protein KatS3mg110_1190 [Pirellulaceae bacterium]
MSTETRAPQIDCPLFELFEQLPATGSERVSNTAQRMGDQTASGCKVDTSDQVDSAGQTKPPTLSCTAFLFSAIKNYLPTALVLGTLAGLGYWGHHSGWRIPKFSELTGIAAGRDAAWCEEHGVPEAKCITCNTDLLPAGKLYGWCKEHGVHECVLHHPQVAQLAKVPVVEPADAERAARALAVRSRPENNPACKLHLRRIQFASAAAAEKSGIDIGLAERGNVIESLRVPGQVVYDPTRVARLASRAAGTVWRVDKNVGDSVRQGDLLALVDAAEVGQAKAELLQAVTELRLHFATQQRLANLGSVVAGKQLLEAETAVTQSQVAVQKAIQTLVNLGLPITYDEVLQTPEETLRYKLQFLGLPQGIAGQLDPQRTTSNLLPIVAPHDGIVVRRDVVTGEVVDNSRALFTVADTQQMWLLLDVPMEEVRYVRLGQPVLFRADGFEQTVHGAITWISTEVDRQTRTVQVRAELSNDGGHLRDEMFGMGQIILREESDAVLVPSSAIHWEGNCYVVFVRDKDWFTSPYKIFHTRSVRPGVVMGDKTEIIAGLLPGEVVATEGSGALLAQLLKSNLGAGCACEQ